MADNLSIPAEVAGAIVKVMAGIKTLGKEDTNKYQKYDFVSVDKFLGAVGPLCAAAGLVILQEEDSVDISTKETTDDYGKTKTSAWLTVRYGFTFVHSSGASYGPMHRSVMVPANGAQAFGSAQSYALKQFMRAQFQIPTGDKDDPDSQQAEPLPNRAAYPPKKTEAPKDTRPIGSGTQFRPESTPFDEHPAAEVKKAAPSTFWTRPSLDLDPKKTKSPAEFADSFLKALAAAPDEQAINRLAADNDLHLDSLSIDDRTKCNECLNAVTNRLADLMAAG